MYSLKRLRKVIITFTNVGKIIFNGKTIKNVTSIDINNNCMKVETSDFSKINGITSEVFDITSLLHLQIIGNIKTMDASNCDVKVEGNCGDVKTASGDINCGSITGNALTKSGDVTVSSGNITGNVETISGDITAKIIGGSIKTVSGDINHV